MAFWNKKEETKPAEAVATTTAVAPLPEQAVKQVKPAMTKKETKRLEYEVIIGKNTVLNGNININGGTRIDGTVDGTVAVDSDLFIGETGVIRATVYAQNATISGAVTGNICCKGRLELTSKARVTGDIKCGVLVIAEGAVFRGKCLGFEDAAHTAVEAPVEEA